MYYERVLTVSTDDKMRLLLGSAVSVCVGYEVNGRVVLYVVVPERVDSLPAVFRLRERVLILQLQLTAFHRSSVPNCSTHTHTHAHSNDGQLIN